MILDVMAHSDSITGLYVKQSEHIIVSCSHDGSIRTFDFRTLKCLQEYPAHQRKYDESIFAIDGSSHLKMLASAGADSTIKISTKN